MTGPLSISALIVTRWAMPRATAGKYKIDGVSFRVSDKQRK